MSKIKALGQFSLFCLIGFGLMALVVFAVFKIWYWFAAIGVCFLGVIGAEIISFLVYKKSISTQYGEWIKRQPVWAYLALGAFSLAMLALEIHLIAYGFRS